MRTVLFSTEMSSTCTVPSPLGWLMMVRAILAGEVEAGGVVAAGLDAERVRDADVAAAPGAVVVTAQQPKSGCCRISWWYCRGAKRRDHHQQQHGHYSSSKC